MNYIDIKFSKFPNGGRLYIFSRDFQRLSKPLIPESKHSLKFLQAVVLADSRSFTPFVYPVVALVDEQTAFRIEAIWAVVTTMMNYSEDDANHDASIALLRQASEVYFLNHQGVWVQMNTFPEQVEAHRFGEPWIMAENCLK